jgi:hypothetical protein
MASEVGWRDLNLEYEQGDRDGKDAIAERLDASRL